MEVLLSGELLNLVKGIRSILIVHLWFGFVSGLGRGVP